MKLTLRKANAVQAAINEAVKGLVLNYTVTLNEFEGVEDQIDAVRNRFWAQSDIRAQMLESLYEIRAKVAQANAAAGINDKLTLVAYLEKQIAHKTMLAGKGAQIALRVLNGQVKKNAESKDESYSYRPNAVTTNIFTEAEIETFRKDAANFKRDKQKLQDELLELNVQTEIELMEKTATFLKSADIL